MKTNPSLTNGNAADIDVLLICALKDEYDQVLKVTDGLNGQGWREYSDTDGWLIADACFATQSGKPLIIRATHASYMGREQVQAVASKRIYKHPVKCIAMSGICAGRRGKEALGDVIFAERLWSYDAGKTTVEHGVQRFQGDPIQYRPSQVWVQRMQHLQMPPDTSWLTERPALPMEDQEDWVLLCVLEGHTPSQHSEFDKECPDWSDVLKRLWQREWLEKPLVLTPSGREKAKELQLLYPKGLPKPTGFQIHVAPMATGAAVTEDDTIFNRLADSMRKVLAVEMEASALGALGDIHNIPVLVAKGVSDFGDPFKDDRYRQFAARASAECLIALLRKSADLLPGHEAKAAGILDSKDPLPSAQQAPPKNQGLILELKGDYASPEAIMAEVLAAFTRINPLKQAFFKKLKLAPELDDKELAEKLLVETDKDICKIIGNLTVVTRDTLEIYEQDKDCISADKLLKVAEQILSLLSLLAINKDLANRLHLVAPSSLHLDLAQSNHASAEIIQAYRMQSNPQYALSKSRPDVQGKYALTRFDLEPGIKDTDIISFICKKFWNIVFPEFLNEAYNLQRLREQIKSDLSDDDPKKRNYYIVVLLGQKEQCGSPLENPAIRQQLSEAIPELPIVVLNAPKTEVYVASDGDLMAKIYRFYKEVDTYEARIKPSNTPKTA